MPRTTWRHRAVLFDVGGTLLDPRESYGAVYRKVLASFGVRTEIETLDAAIAETSRELLARHEPGVDRFSFEPGGEAGFWRRFVSGTLGRVGGDPDDDGLVDDALGALRAEFADPACWHVHADGLLCLERLADEGIPMAVVSNWDSLLPSCFDGWTCRGSSRPWPSRPSSGSRSPTRICFIVR